MEVRLSIAIEAYMLAKRAERLSENTLNDYRNTFNKFQRFLEGDQRVSRINEKTVTSFLAGVKGVSKKPVRNYHTGLSSLWNYLVETGNVKRNIVRAVKAPRPSQKQINPYSRHEITALLSAIEDDTSAVRNRAIILLLLDCGIRASELCNLRLKDIDFSKQQIFIKQGKGDKSRRTPFSTATKVALQNYIKRHRNMSKTNFVFWTRHTNPFNRTSLFQLIVRIGKTAGVDDCGIHRFRHTFAIQFLRNGGNIYTLQALLGHSSLDMVKRYLSLAQTDLERDHKKASPVMGWNL